MSEKTLAKPGHGLWENTKVVLQALAIAVVVRTVVVQPFTIPSSSMMPTLLTGDYIVVNKFAYGFSRYSLPFSPNLFHGRILEFSKPKRGDVIVFRLPSNPDVDYIKRLVGLPGDHVQMKNGVLFINGHPVPQAPDGVFTSDDRQDPGTNIPVLREVFDNGRSFDTLNEDPMSPGDNTKEFVVPPDHYFFMGDNRDNSLDSRFDVGYVPAENLVGRASLIAFSLGNDTSFTQFWRWPANLRSSRFFKSID